MSWTPGTYNKYAPPVPVSTSLEGLEIGVPPPKRALEEKPLPKLPDRTSSIICSEPESSGIEIVDCNDVHPSRRKRATSESPEPSGRFYRRRNIDIDHRNSVTRSNERSSPNLKTFLLDADQHRPPQPAKANHYFREKKWDIFPELAPQSARCQTPVRAVATPKPASPSASSPKKYPTRPKLPRAFSKQRFCHQGEVFGVSLKPVASQIQQTIAIKTSQLRVRKRPSQASLPVPVSVPGTSRSRNNSLSSSNNDSDTTTLVGIIDSSDIKRSVATMRQRMREMAPWSRTDSSGDEGGSISLWKSTSTSVSNLVSSLETKVPVSSLKLSKNHTQQSAVDEEGSISLWKSTSTSALNAVSSSLEKTKIPVSSLKFPKSQSQAADTTSTISKINDPPSSKVVTTTKPILAIQTHFDEASVVSLPAHLPNKTIRAKSNSSYILIALDGAKRKFAAVQAARRRAELKKHIRVVGPIDKYPDGSINQWV